MASPFSDQFWRALADYGVNGGVQLRDGGVGPFDGDVLHQQVSPLFGWVGDKHGWFERGLVVPWHDVAHLSEPCLGGYAGHLREQILLHTDKEVPHGIAVVVERWQKDKKCTHIGVVVHVDKDSHRPIILGKGGARIKSIATRARARIEKLLDEHVNLEITVRVTPGWYESPALLDELGYQADGQ